jgi:anti-anti-sigma factor
MGVLDGVVVAVLASVVMLLGRSSRPHVAFLGRIPGTNRFSDLARHPENEPIPGVVAFRVQASLLYFNVDHVLDVVRDRVRDQKDVRTVVCDLSNVPYVDIAGARMLRRLHEEFTGSGIDFKIVEAHGSVRDLLRAEGLEDLVGSITRYSSLAALLDDGDRAPSQPDGN